MKYINEEPDIPKIEVEEVWFNNDGKEISGEINDIKLPYDSIEAQGFEESKVLQWIKTQYYMHKKLTKLIKTQRS